MEKDESIVKPEQEVLLAKSLREQEESPAPIATKATRPRSLDSRFLSLSEPVWEQQEEESHDDFMAFLYYAQMPVSNRSISAAYRGWANINSSKVLPERYSRCAHLWCWEERASEWDIERSRELERKWLERQLEWRENNWDAGAKLRAAAIPAMEHIDMEEMSSPINIAKFLALGSELQEKALPTSLQLRGDQVKTILEGIAPEKREVVLKILMAEITSR